MQRVISDRMLDRVPQLSSVSQGLDLKEGAARPASESYDFRRSVLGKVTMAEVPAFASVWILFHLRMNDMNQDSLGLPRSW